MNIFNILRVQQLFSTSLFDLTFMFIKTDLLVIIDIFVLLFILWVNKYWQKRGLSVLSFVTNHYGLASSVDINLSTMVKYCSSFIGTKKSRFPFFYMFSLFSFHHKKLSMFSRSQPIDLPFSLYNLIFLLSFCYISLSESWFSRSDLTISVTFFVLQVL